MATAVDILIGNPTVVPFGANQTVQQQLQNGYAFDYLAIRLTGNLMLAGYTTPPAKFVESVENLIAFYQLQATGKSSGATTDQLCAVDGPFLRFKTRMMEGTDVTRTDVGTMNGLYGFETNFKRYFADPRSDKSKLTRLYTATLSQLNASLQFRDQTAMVYGGVGGTANLSGVQVTTQGRAYLGLTPPMPSPYVREMQRTYTVQQSQDNFIADRVPLGNILRRQYFKGMLGPTNFADPSDTVFGSSVKAEGPHVGLTLNQVVKKLDYVYQALRTDNKLLFGVESIPAGYSIFEPARNRRLNQSLPMAGVDTAVNNFDVNFTPGSINTIQVTDETIIGVSAAQWSA